MTTKKKEQTKETTQKMVATEAKRLVIKEVLQYVWEEWIEPIINSNP